MAKFVEFQMEVEAAVSSETGEDDGIAAVVCPVLVNADEIREFYPRKGGRTGTRLVFKNGAGRPVLNSYEDVRSLLAVH